MQFYRAIFKKKKKKKKKTELFVVNFDILNNFGNVKHYAICLHKASSTPPLFIEMSVQSQECKR